MAIVTSRLPGTLLGLLGGTLIAAVSFVVRLYGRAWKYDVKGVQAVFSQFQIRQAESGH